jgi:hypothetical protein
MRPCLIHTCHAAPMLCSYHAVLFKAIERGPVGYPPAFGFFRLPRGVPRRLLSEAYQSSSQRSIPTTVTSGSSTKKPLNCWTSSSDISGYHADFHEGDGTVGAEQGCGTACYVWIGLKSWVCGHSPPGIVGSTRWGYFWVLCVVRFRSLCWADRSSRISYRLSVTESDQVQQ